MRCPVFETTDNDSTLQDSLKIDVHPQDVSKDAGFFIKSSGTIGTLRIYGSVRLAGAYDLNGLTDANSFSTYDIPGRRGCNYAGQVLHGAQSNQAWT